MDNDAQEDLGHYLSPFEPTFLRCPSGWLNAGSGAGRVSVIGVPYDLLSRTGPGAANGPPALRVASSNPGYCLDETSGLPAGWFDYYENCQILSAISFADLGDITFPHGASASELGRRLGAVVARCYKLGSFPLLFGGDHSLTYWSVKALAEQPLSILHLDAHSDLAEIPGPVHCNASVATALLGLPGVDSLITVGLRGILPVRQDPVRSRHHLVSVKGLREKGAEAIIYLLPPDLPCYISLDVDVLDPSIAPGTNSPEPDGLSFQEVREILVTAGKRRRIIAADVVEINALHDTRLLTAKLATRLILSLLGSCVS
jgi:agmatinase